MEAADDCSADTEVTCHPLCRPAAHASRLGECQRQEQRAKQPLAQHEVHALVEMRRYAAGSDGSGVGDPADTTFRHGEGPHTPGAVWVACRPAADHGCRQVFGCARYLLSVAEPANGRE